MSSALGFAIQMEYVCNRPQRSTYTHPCKLSGLRLVQITRENSNIFDSFPVSSSVSHIMSIAQQPPSWLQFSWASLPGVFSAGRCTLKVCFPRYLLQSFVPPGCTAALQFAHSHHNNPLGWKQDNSRRVNLAVEYFQCGCSSLFFLSVSQRSGRKILVLSTFNFKRWLFMVDANRPILILFIKAEMNLSWKY